jgi:hypothetical protein
MSDPGKTQKAIDAFFPFTSGLFHIYSRQQLRDFVQDNLQMPSKAPSSAIQKERAVSIASVSAVAAVGYRHAARVPELSTEVAYYDTARFYLDAVLENSPLDAVKLCALLALYNIPSKATVALSYVDMGESLAQRLGLNNREYCNTNVSSEEWLLYRKTWRALRFLSR